MRFCGDPKDLWSDFCEALVEGVIPEDAQLILYGRGGCALVWSGSGLAHAFATFEDGRQWLICERQRCWECKEEVV